jgi:hypothetical protein
VAAGVFALHDAANRCSPNQRGRFATYAKQRIRGAILDSLKKQRSAEGALRSPKSQTASPEPACDSRSTPGVASRDDASRDDQFGTTLACLQKALAAGGKSRPAAIEESATDPAPTRRRGGGDR